MNEEIKKEDLLIVEYAGFWRRFSAFLFCIGYLMAGFTIKKQALHDIMAGCLVIRK